MLDSRLVFHVLHIKQLTVFVSPISFVEKRLTLTAFKRIFSQKYNMVTQLAAYFSSFNTTTQLVAIKFFDKSLYCDIAHRSHVETVNRMILWHKTTKHFNSEAQTVIITISISGSTQGSTTFFNTILSLFVFEFHSGKLFKVATRLHVSAKFW